MIKQTLKVKISRSTSNKSELLCLIAELIFSHSDVGFPFINFNTMCYGRQ